ncbi:MAG: tetratricopeptide repeat protein [Myxococcaceae bacterium]
MRHSPFDPRVVQLAEQLGRAQRLGQEGKNDEALVTCTRVMAEAEALGVVSVAAMWTAGVVCDNQRNFPMAVDFCRRAVEADPADPSLRNSYSIVLRHIREALLDEDREVDDTEIRGLYDLLADAGDADEACHVRFAAHLVAAGKSSEARSFLTAVVRLHPASVDSWTLLAQVAEPGDLEQLRGCVPTKSQLRGPQGAFFQQAGTAQS